MNKPFFSLLTIAVILFSFSNCSKNNPSSPQPAPTATEVPLKFEKRYGQGDTYYYNIYDALQITGGYILAGSATMGGNEDMLLMKCDLSGNTLWTTTAADGNYKKIYSVIPSGDGGYIGAGADSPGIYNQMYLVKADAGGNTLWERSFGGGTGNETAYSVMPAHDGGYILAGQANSFGAGSGDIYVVKTDATGNCLWSYTYGGAGNDAAKAICAAGTTGYYIAGYTYSFGAVSADGYVVKIDTDGSYAWGIRNYSGPSTYDAYNDAAATADGGCIAAGQTGNNGFLVKVEASGATTAVKSLGGSNTDFFTSVRAAPGGYILGGQTQSLGAGNWAVWLLKANALCDMDWEKGFGGAVSDYGEFAIPTSDGGYLCGGAEEDWTAGDYHGLVYKTDSAGLKD